MVGFINRHKIFNDTTNSFVEDFSGYERSFKRNTTDLLEYNHKLKSGQQLFNAGLISDEYRKLFFIGNLLNKDILNCFNVLTYSSLYGLNSYRNDYSLEDNLFHDSLTHSGESAKRSVKKDKLLSHHLLDYIQTALVLREKEALSFYSTLQSRESIPGRYYFAHDKDFEQLLIFLCGKDNAQLQAHLQAMKSRDYLQSLSGLPFQTAHLIPYLQSLFLPLVDIYLAAFLEQEDIFNQTLYDALVKHKAYYESEENGESRSSLPQGWVSLPLTAACAIAHDRGMKREVESDYIPEWLVKGEFEGLPLIVE